MLVDSHAHIQLSQFDRDRHEVLQRAKSAGIEQILVVGFDLKTSQQAVELAMNTENLWATVGMHPHDAKDLTNTAMDTFQRLADHPKVIALGEMGLDYYRDLSPRSIQKTAFEQQLDLAEELDMPIIVHNREAYHDILPILRSRKGRISGVLHCFSGDVDIMKQTLDIGFHIGIGGPVTYKKSDDLQTVAKQVPANRLLIETDCPWLAPQFRRGKRNEPSYVISVAERIAELRGTPAEEIGQITTQNFVTLFSNQNQ
ncbi:TPA: TatD family deoxyribonuclease [Candidatus Poribacteria bacterium]|jgi:TatD DNase family protein|nr:TatD family deoxyribonuclease [Candidatus Poribacteria bacterium]HIA68718.1 TatD family deoxyribonuclease [Candidatus Poribacteria bacterium]HIB90051.1 TatD family deoxyribonuclease [Candidatus Poribacteria bacterium]HIB98099.1 TatD family deoxyribonuclease [Candidatus Poribacteria bacterium]HIN27913.1 TatD family deoxyribonuclease [Candidatus Poribacteria bacterium]